MWISDLSAKCKSIELVENGVSRSRQCYRLDTKSTSKPKENCQTGLTRMSDLPAQTLLEMRKDPVAADLDR